MIAFVRDKNKVPEDLKNQVSIVVGDVTNADSVSDAITGVDGVAVVLGTRNDLSESIYSICLLFMNVFNFRPHNCFI